VRLIRSVASPWPYGVEFVRLRKAPVETHHVTRAALLLQHLREIQPALVLPRVHLEGPLEAPTGGLETPPRPPERPGPQGPEYSPASSSGSSHTRPAPPGPAGLAQDSGEVQVELGLFRVRFDRCPAGVLVHSTKLTREHILESYTKAGAMAMPDE
jgi:hypothetical protein